MKNSGDESKYEIKEAKNGKFHFSLKAGNGQIIGSSQMYKTESGMKNVNFLKIAPRLHQKLIFETQGPKNLPKIDQKPSQNRYKCNQKFDRFLNGFLIDSSFILAAFWVHFEHQNRLKCGNPN